MRELRDPRLGLVTITEVRMSSDLGYATVYYSVLGADARLMAGRAGHLYLGLAHTSLTNASTAWRVTASKSLFIFGLAIGAGQDKYTSAADLSVSVQDGLSPRV